MFLVHATTTSNFKSAVKYGKLLTTYERDELGISNEGVGVSGVKRGSPWSLSKNRQPYISSDEFPGLYTSYVVHRDDFAPMSADIVLVFGRDLLRQKNFHLNLSNLNGWFAAGNTFFPEDVNQSFLKRARAYLRRHGVATDDNEVVFHDGLDTRLVEYILVGGGTQTKQTKLISNLRRALPRSYAKKLMRIEDFDRSKPVKTSSPRHLNLTSEAVRLFYTPYTRYTGVQNPFNVYGKINPRVALRYVREMAFVYGGVPRARLSRFKSVLSLENFLEKKGIYLQSFAAERPPAAKRRARAATLLEFR